MEAVPELPQDIIHKILALLKTEEGIYASLLSKAWLQAWRTRPVLDFNFDYLEYKFSQLTRQQIHNYVNQTMLRYREHRMGIQTFKLEFCGKPRGRWFEIAMENKVKNLEIHARLVTFPEIILEAESLEKLSVRGSMVKLRVPQKIMCNRLKELHLSALRLDEVDLQRIMSSCKMMEFLELRRTEFLNPHDNKLQFPEKLVCCHLKQLRLGSLTLDEVRFQRILSSCKPVIELLTIDDCNGIEHYNVNKVPKLKEFSICTRGGRVDVEAPCLQSFTCCEWLHLGAEWLNLGAAKNLRSLKLCSVGITETFFFDFGCKFPSLEDLTVKSCYNLQAIRMSSQSLKNLTLYDRKGHLKELQVDAPSMVRFDFQCTLIPSTSFTSTPNHWVSNIDIGKVGNSENSWFRLKEFLTKLIESEIYLHVEFDEDIVFDLEEENSRDGPLLPRPQVQNLSMDNSYWYQNGIVLDGIFWVCCPKIIKLLSSYCNYEFTKFVFNVLMDIRNGVDEDKKDAEIEDDHNSRQIKFWKKDLKEAKVEVCVMVNSKWVPWPCSDWKIFFAMRSSELFVFDLEWSNPCIR